MIAHFGELMALLAALIFAWTSIFFTAAGQRLGVTTVNLMRLLGGASLLMLAHLVVTGRAWPAGVPLASLLWIGASGVVGLAVGDSALFRAFTLIGPRRGMMAMATAPVFTAVLAWPLLGERLGWMAIAGILVVIGGVMLAVLGRDPGGGQFADLPSRTRRLGFLLAFVAAAGQGLGSGFVKIGMAGGAVQVDALSATLVRMVFACGAYWAAALVQRPLIVMLRPLRDRRGALNLIAATFLGPFVSVWISIVAIRHAEAGVAQALLGAVPIFVILPAWIVYRDRPTVLSLVGVVVAVAGGTLLFLR